MSEEQEKELKEGEIEAIRAEIAAEEFEEHPPAPVKEPEKAEPEPEEDPWAGVSPTLRKTFDEMAAKVAIMDTMAARLKQTESRIGAMQNKLSAAEKAAQEKPPAPTKEEIEKAAAENQSWEALKEEFPEWAEAIDDRFAKTSTEFDKRQKALEESQLLSSQQFEKKVADLADTIAETKEKTVLSLKYPDWETTILTPEYTDWIKTQPEEVRQKTRSTLAKDAISVLDDFSNKQTKKPPAEIAAERKTRLEEAVVPKGKKAIPIKGEADMTREELRGKVAAEVWAE